MFALAVGGWLAGWLGVGGSRVGGWVAGSGGTRHPHTCTRCLHVRYDLERTMPETPQPVSRSRPPGRGGGR